jgi:5,10-methylene-tetrahydrofolate dehydrogenase/methenyl tetrahydrofolate cyclohydrolase
VVADYNKDPAVHGILVQLPLPPHIDEKVILDAISIEKDVDGFHPNNIGMLAMRGRAPRFVSCTPKVPPRPLYFPDHPCKCHVCTACTACRKLGILCCQGCIELLERSGVEISGKIAVVIGRSNIVGIPAAMLLQVSVNEFLISSYPGARFAS